MASEKETQVFIKDLREKYLPHLSVDCVIFGFHAGQLKVLSLGFLDTNRYILPGGYVEKNENVDDAAIRILHERTGLSNIYLEQFHTFGHSERVNDKVFQEGLEKFLGLKLSEQDWWIDRVVSVCYYALLDYTKVQPTADILTSSIDWFDVQNLPDYLLDHKNIVNKAITSLQNDLDRRLIGFNLLGETFTMGELQKLYEAVYQKEFVRTNFQRKMLSLDVLERLDKKYTGKAHKAPYLYKFKASKGDQSL